jgi:hypothetical protein
MIMSNGGDDEKFNKAPCFECGYTRGHAPGCVQAIIGEQVLPLENATALEGLSLRRGEGGERAKYLSMRSPATSMEVAFRHVILLAPTTLEALSLHYEQDGRSGLVTRSLPKGERVSMRGQVDVKHFKVDRLEGPMLIESCVSVASVRAGDKTEEWKDRPPLWAARHRTFIDVRTVNEGAELEVVVQLRAPLRVEDLELALVGRAIRTVKF